MNKMKPNSFQIPNTIVDDFIQLVNGNELKIYLIIVRKTKGWNKEFDGISISQFIKFSGISSHNTIRKSLKKLAEINLIKEVKQDGKFSLFFIADPYQNLTMSKNEPIPKNDIVPLPKIDNTNIHYPKEEEKEEEKQKHFEEFYNWLPKINIKNKKFYKNQIRKNLLLNDKQTLENYRDFLSELPSKNIQIESKDTSEKQFIILKQLMNEKTPNEIYELNENKQYKNLFTKQTNNFINKFGGLVDLRSKVLNDSFNTWLLEQLKKEKY